MKIALYLENVNLPDVDLRRPERGNPGIGGTEFNFVTLACALTDRHPEHEFRLFANRTAGLPDRLAVSHARDCVDAVEQAVARGFEFFVWRPTVRDDARALVERLADLDIKVIVWAHNTPKSAYLDAFADAPAVRRFVPVGFEQARRIGEHPIQRKLTVIHNGFAQEVPAPSAKDPRSVVYLGSMIPVKGFGLLAQAWPQVLQRHPDATLTVVGSGRLYNRSNALGPWSVADAAFETAEIIPHLAGPDGEPLPSVRFLGILGAEKYPLLSRAAVGVVNPRGTGENCPGSAIEFLAASTAVVSARREGLLDVVDHEVTGLLGEGLNDLVDHICRLLDDPVLAQTLGRNGPAVVASRFGYDAVSAQWMRLFHEEMQPDFGRAAVPTGRYFPPLSAEELACDVAFRRSLASLEPPEALERYVAFARGRPDPRHFEASMGAHAVAFVSAGRRLHCPPSTPPVVWLMMSLGYLEWLRRKYTLPGWLEVQPGDRVFDCGAFVGGFALAAAAVAREVHCFEPDPGNLACLASNVAAEPVVRVNDCGLFDREAVLDFNLSGNPVDSSLLRPDAGGVREVRPTPVTRIDTYCARHGITRIDFLKVEAEGVEVEVVAGIGSLPVDRIAVDCSPERNGQSPFDEIEQSLRDRGYETARRGWVLFARRPPGLPGPPVTMPRSDAPTGA